MEDQEAKVDRMLKRTETLDKMRDTMFRLNRKVYEGESKLAHTETVDRDIYDKMSQIYESEQEENRKIREEFQEGIRTSRNQAITVGIVALALAGFMFLALSSSIWDFLKDTLGL